VKHWEIIADNLSNTGWSWGRFVGYGDSRSSSALIGSPFCHRKFASGRCTEAAAANPCPRPAQQRRSPNRKKRIPLVIQRDLATKNYFCTPENQLQRTTLNISEIRGLVLTMRSDWSLISQFSGRFHLRNYLIWTNETGVRVPQTQSAFFRSADETLFHRDTRQLRTSWG
jgi:hypothetical protein